MIHNVLGARGKLLRGAGQASSSRSFGSSLVRYNYDSTLKNLKIGSHTRLKCSGLIQSGTGKQATANAKESIEWGTNIVGGVRPGFEGEHLGLPVLPTVRKAMEKLRPDATGIYVAAHQATAAIEEAIKAEVPLIVAVAEHIPLHDMIRIHAMLKTQRKSRLVGANSPGIISAVGKCRIGFQPLPCFEPGRWAKSGGEAEIDAADWIKEYRAKTEKPKPIAAIIGGIKAVPGRIMGHAGAFTLPGEPSAQDKVAALQAAGCAIVNHPARFGPVLKSMLGGSTPLGYGVVSPSTGTGFQRRGIHTFMGRPTSRTVKYDMQQTRSIYLTQSTAFDLLRQRGIPVVDSTSIPDEGHLLAVTLNRSTNSPCIIASLLSHGDTKNLKRFDYDYGVGAEALDIGAIASQLGLDASNNEVISSLRTIVTGLVTLFAEKEAYLLETRLVTSKTAAPGIAIASARFGFDDAAHRSGGRQADIQALRDMSVEDAAEVGVEKDGIVYIKLPDGSGEGEVANIGTLVNGAGLAMNTVDAIADAGGRAANFLDTGGKATSETVKKSFEVILKDPRVKVINPTIHPIPSSVPVVVRIRGTNEKEGQQIIAESGLPLFAFDDFDEAAKKAIELAKQP
ncbi:hypothetical protein CIB48_g3407 [Xylaria polymorpha]|nr:hypothetical protein CIB48_g3407 [Xylaria polymorpha]